jgi:hypothetical protein
MESIQKENHSTLLYCNIIHTTARVSHSVSNLRPAARESRKKVAEKEQRGSVRIDGSGRRKLRPEYSPALPAFPGGEVCGGGAAIRLSGAAGMRGGI